MVALLIFDAALLVAGTSLIVDFVARGSRAELPRPAAASAPTASVPPPVAGAKPALPESAHGVARPLRPAHKHTVRPVAVHTPRGVRSRERVPDSAGQPAPPELLAPPPGPPSEAPQGPSSTEPAPAPSDGTSGGEPPESPASAEVEQSNVRFVVSHHLPQVQSCYERALKQSPGATGTIDLAFTLGNDGRATFAHAVGNTTGSDDLAACLAGLVESWSFPRPARGPIDFVYPFAFAGGG
jgi:hypothetical protein